jgi:probable HAF family extracellular repeat protein
MRVLAAVALLSLPFLTQAGEAETRYRYRYMVHELGAPEDIVSVAAAVSASGRFAAGQAWYDDALGYQAAVFQLGLRRTFILPGGTSDATGVNSNGEVVGTFWNPAEGPWLTSRRAFYWKAGNLTPLPRLGSGSTVANAINDAGTIAGWFHAMDGAQHAYTYSNSIPTDLGTWGAAGAEAIGINRNGDLAGVRYHGTEPPQEAVRVYRGRVEPLGQFFPGLNSIAKSINRRGDVAGVAFKTLVETELPVQWPFAVLGSKLQRLVPDQPGWSGIALSINSDRQVVGTYGRPPEGGGAFLWEDGKLTDLSSLPEVKAAGWVHLITAIAINDDGVIVGAGDTTGGRTRGFMLVPIRGR